MDTWSDWHEADIERQERWQQLDDLDARERERWDRMYERGGDQTELRVEQLMQCNGLTRDEAEIVAARTKSCPRCGRAYVNAGAHMERCDGQPLAASGGTGQ